MMKDDCKLKRCGGKVSQYERVYIYWEEKD